MSKILIISPDIEGPVRNGGIGTAFTSLAVMLSGRNYEVDILYTSKNYSESADAFEHWFDIYKKNNINLIQLSSDSKLHVDAPYFRKQSYEIYQWLKEHNNYQKIIGCEWQGGLYYSLLAKKQGLEFGNTEFIINTHGSSMWADEGNYQLPGDQNHLESYYLEQKCVEMADKVISPSAYLLRWMEEKKWHLPSDSRVILNCEPASIFKTAQTVVSRASKESLKGIELVFFGRLEIRKGLDLFLKSLKLLGEAELSNISSVTFMGKGITIDGISSAEHIASKMNDLAISYQIISDYDRTRANEYLKKKNILAVIPSLSENSPYTVYECLIANVNFIASNVGGIGELIPETAHVKTLFDLTPISLSNKITLRLKDVDCHPGLIHDQAFINKHWNEVFSASYYNDVVDIDSEHYPLVSVCLTHHDRSELLQQAIASLRTQTYQNFEVILVDDGSQKEESHRYLDLISREFEQRRWTLIKSSNNYLGAARNLAVSHAKGEYVLFMDDDNVAKPYEIELFVKAAINSDADILTTPSDLIFGNEFPSPFRQMTHCWLPLGDNLNIAAFNNCFGDANALIRRSVFNDVGGFTEDFGVGHEDWEFFLRAVLKGHRLMVIPEALFWYRVASSGMLLSGNKSRNDFRSFRPFIEENVSYNFGMSLVPALMKRIQYLESQINDVNSNTLLGEIHAKVENLYSQQQGGWAHDRFMVLDHKLDHIESVVIRSVADAKTSGITYRVLRKIKRMITK